MKLDMIYRLALAAVCCGAAAARLPADEPTAKTPADAAAEEENAVVWSSDMVDGYRRAFADRKPLFIVVGAKWNASCRKMLRELESAPVRAELARWTPVCLDHDVNAEEAEQLGVVSVPALRIHSPAGRPAAEHNGYLSPEKLTSWLKENYSAAAAAADDVLLESGKPSTAAVIKLVKQFDQRNPALREAAVRRLVPYPNEAKAAVVKTFCQRGLSARLAAMDALEQWRAPLAGFDPWRPETFTPERIAALEKWKEQDIKPDDGPKPLTAEQLADARSQIGRMLQGDEVEAEAVRQQLARFGAALMPEVYARLKEAASDRDRRRLLALRYRLAADDALALSWPGGLERLADGNHRVRRKAAEELAGRAAAGDQALLLELFADPDPLVREISLRGLRRIGGPEANAVLVRLLDDPDLNVRAAVLKQIESAPSEAMTAVIIKYLEKETDADLIGHGIRVLQAVKGPAAVKCLMSLLKHKSWQVRAEAAAALGKLEQPDEYHSFSSSGFSSGRVVQSDDGTQLTVEVYAALLGLLDDAEPFVVAKAVEGLSDADLAVAVEPLAKAAEKYPDLAPTILKMLGHGNTMRDKALPHLHRFAKHEEPRIRAAAVAALCSISFDDMEERVLAALDDPDETVRMAAAGAALDTMENLHNRAINQRSRTIRELGNVIGGSSPATMDGNVFSMAAKLLSGAIKSASPGAPPPALPAAPTSPADKSDSQLKKGAATGSSGSAGKKSRYFTAGQEAEKPKPEKTPEEYWWDQWLRQCYAGEHRPKWTAKMVPPLEKMLAAESPKERIAAAVLLVPLGKADKSLPVLMNAVRENPDQMGAAAKALTWLAWEERAKLFRGLRPLATDETALRALVGGLHEVSDPRSAELYWQLLAEPKIDDETAQGMAYYMIASYSDTPYVSSDIKPAAKRKIVEDVKPRAFSGSDWQRRIALMMLAYADQGEAAEAAAKLAGDDKLDEKIRNDAFRVQLGTMPPTQANKQALAELKGTDQKRRRIALAFLAHGPQAFASGSAMYWAIGTRSYSTGSNDNQPIVPRAPAGVEIGDVRGLIADADPETAAYAGYLAALLGEPEGIRPLLRFWRDKQRDSDLWTKSAYRAVAVLDDPAYISVLRDIFAKLDKYDMKEFYWTIRIMSGNEILEFRKQVREAMKKADSF